MTRAARTLFCFGLYLAAVGVALMLFPNAVLRLFAMPLTSEVWIRLVGMLALYLALYDLAAARGEWSGFIALSIPMRLAAIVFFTGFVLLAAAPPMLVVLAVPDVAFALWTWRVLRASALAKHP